MDYCLSPEVDQGCHGSYQRFGKALQHLDGGIWRGSCLWLWNRVGTSKLHRVVLIIFLRWWKVAHEKLKAATLVWGAQEKVSWCVLRYKVEQGIWLREDDSVPASCSMQIRVPHLGTARSSTRMRGSIPKILIKSAARLRSQLSRKKPRSEF